MDGEAIKNEVNYLDLISEKDIEKIRNYRYSGKDDSYLYDKCLSPLAQWMVDNKVPPTVA